MADRGVPFRVIVCGEQFRTAPPIFAEARRRLADRIEHWGFAADRATYHALLGRADVVVSTAIHEFFGLAVLEAAAAGAMPLLPRRLSYVELFDAARWPRIIYEFDEELADRLVEVLAHPAPPGGLTEHARSFAWPDRIGAFDAAFESAI